ncbi:hypothetical protein V1504DRAFT_433065 [Lipomyces starkeyi]
MLQRGLTLRSEDQDLTPCTDGSLRITLDLLHTFTASSQLRLAAWEGEGLTQALSWASINWIANIKVDVCFHLSQHLERWIALRMGADLVQELPRKAIWRIASRIAETLAWKEKAAFARAQLFRQPDPTPPNYIAPATLDDLLGEKVINNLEEPLSDESRRILWRFFHSGYP